MPPLVGISTPHSVGALPSLPCVRGGAARSAAEGLFLTQTIFFFALQTPSLYNPSGAGAPAPFTGGCLSSTPYTPQGRPSVARPKTIPRSVCQDSFLQNREKHPSSLVLTGQQIFANALTRGGKRATMCLPVGVRRFRPPAPGRRRAASMPDAWADARRSAVSRAQCFCRLARGAPARHRGGTVPVGNSVPQGTHTKGKKYVENQKKRTHFHPGFQREAPAFTRRAAG